MDANVNSDPVQVDAETRLAEIGTSTMDADVPDQGRMTAENDRHHGAYWHVCISDGGETGSIGIEW